MRIFKYIFKMSILNTLISTLVIIGLVWVSQSFRSIKFIFEKEGTIIDFFQLYISCMPAWLSISVSFGFFLGVFITFNLNSERTENMNLVDLYNYIILMKKLGVNYSDHLIYLLKQLFQPILIVSLILISAPLILKNNERKFPLTIMCLTILIGFVIYFLVDFMYVLGSMEKLNPFIAGIGPIGVCFFIGCYLVSAFDEIKK